MFAILIITCGLQIYSLIDYTEDKIGTDENEEYPRSDAASANEKLCPTLVEIVKHFFELHVRSGRKRPQQT